MTSSLGQRSRQPSGTVDPCAFVDSQASNHCQSVYPREVANPEPGRYRRPSLGSMPFLNAAVPLGFAMP